MLKTDFKNDLGNVGYRIPCHGRVQNIGKKTEAMRKRTGQKITVQINTVERGGAAHCRPLCSGVASRRMARVRFTQQLRRFVETPEFDTDAPTLRTALNDAFVLNPVLRGYVLDDQGHLRMNVVVFIDGKRSHDRVLLDDVLRSDSQVHVLQALSGG